MRNEQLQPRTDESSESGEGFYGGYTKKEKESVPVQMAVITRQMLHECYRIHDGGPSFSADGIMPAVSSVIRNKQEGRIEN